MNGVVRNLTSYGGRAKRVIDLSGSRAVGKPSHRARCPPPPPPQHERESGDGGDGPICPEIPKLLERGSNSVGEHVDSISLRPMAPSVALLGVRRFRLIKNASPRGSTDRSGPEKCHPDHSGIRLTNVEYWRRCDSETRPENAGHGRAHRDRGSARQLQSDRASGRSMAPQYGPRRTVPYDPPWLKRASSEKLLRDRAMFARQLGRRRSPRTQTRQSVVRKSCARS